MCVGGAGGGRGTSPRRAASSRNSAQSSRPVWLTLSSEKMRCSFIAPLNGFPLNGFVPFIGARRHAAATAHLLNFIIVSKRCAGGTRATLPRHEAGPH